MTIEEAENEIAEEFELFGDDWEAKYQHMIDMGKALPPMDEKYKTEENIIKGCQSRAWLRAEMKDGRIVYEADSEGLIPKAMVALMIRVLSGQRPEDIAKAKLGFIDRIGLREHLMMTRENGLVNMINKMKLEAIRLIQHS